LLVQVREVASRPAPKIVSSSTVEASPQGSTKVPLPTEMETGTAPPPIFETVTACASVRHGALCEQRLLSWPLADTNSNSNGSGLDVANGLTEAVELVLAVVVGDTEAPIVDEPVVVAVADPDGVALPIADDEPDCEPNCEPVTLREAELEVEGVIVILVLADAVVVTVALADRVDELEIEALLETEADNEADAIDVGVAERDEPVDGDAEALALALGTTLTLADIVPVNVIVRLPVVDTLALKLAEAVASGDCDAVTDTAAETLADIVADIVADTLAAAVGNAVADALADTVAEELAAAVGNAVAVIVAVNDTEALAVADTLEVVAHPALKFGTSVIGGTMRLT
jgi:hypothetical protein